MTRVILPCLTAGTLLAGLCLAGPAVAGDVRDAPDARNVRDARATAAPATRFQMPFPCGQAWTGTTRESHSPSRWSIDWNRTDDAGDPVVAAAPGVVVRAEPRGSSGYGHWVMLEHANGERTIYAHLDQVTVALGQAVDQAALLGTVGNTGNSFGAHLHFEERSGNTVLPPYFAGTAFTFGSTLVSQNCVDVPLAGDFVDGPEAEVAVFRRERRGRFVVQRVGQAPLEISFGSGADQPVVGDWDGDGKANPGVRIPARSLFRLTSPAGVARIELGRPRDLPVAGDWDGDGRWEVGVRRPATGVFVLRAADGSRTRAVLGDPDDLPVTGDWDGDGRWEVGVRRPGTGVFVLRAADGSRTRAALGDPDDLPVTGDWDGDRRTDLGVYDQATATFTLRIVDVDGLSWTAQVPFGVAGDLPVTGDWDGNGRTDVGVWNPTTAAFSQRRAARPTAQRATVTQTMFGNPR